MGLMDRITGRTKQAAGDLLGDEDIKREGVVEEHKADEKAKLAQAEAEAERAEQVAERQAEKVDRLDKAT